MGLKPTLAGLALCATALPALAQMHVEDAWVQATVPHQQTTGAFMKITSDQPVRLVEVRSSAAATAEIHQMKMDGDVMRMRQVEGIDVVPGGSRS